MLPVGRDCKSGERRGKGTGRQVALQCDWGWEKRGD